MTQLGRKEILRNTKRTLTEYHHNVLRAPIEASLTNFPSIQCSSTVSFPSLLNGYCASPYLSVLTFPQSIITVRNVNQQVWIALGSISIIGVSAYPVFFKETRPGHEIFSSEKPEVIREAQESRRKEQRRQIKEQREQMAAEQEAIQKSQQQ